MRSRSTRPTRGSVRFLSLAAFVAGSVAGCAGYATQEIASGGVLSVRSNRTEGPPSRAEILFGASGTYIGKLLADRDSMIERWPNRVSDPIRVWIDSSKLEQWETGFPSAVREAFAEWEGTGIPVRFEFVESASKADVRVHWADRFRDKTGSTSWRTNSNGWILGSDVTLASHMSDGHPLDRASVRQIALHEIGHAIGLCHSDNPRDVMAPLVRADALSAGDVATVRLVYAFPAGRVR